MLIEDKQSFLKETIINNGKNLIKLKEEQVINEKNIEDFLNLNNEIVTNFIFKNFNLSIENKKQILEVSYNYSNAFIKKIYDTLSLEDILKNNIALKYKEIEKEEYLKNKNIILNYIKVNDDYDNSIFLKLIQKFNIKELKKLNKQEIKMFLPFILREHNELINNDLDFKKLLQPYIEKEATRNSILYYPFDENDNKDKEIFNNLVKSEFIRDKNYTLFNNFYELIDPNILFSLSYIDLQFLNKDFIIKNKKIIQENLLKINYDIKELFKNKYPEQLFDDIFDDNLINQLALKIKNKKFIIDKYIDKDSTTKNNEALIKLKLLNVLFEEEINKKENYNFSYVFDLIEGLAQSINYLDKNNKNLITTNYMNLLDKALNNNIDKLDFFDLLLFNNRNGDKFQINPVGKKINENILFFLFHHISGFSSIDFIEEQKQYISNNDNEINKDYFNKHLLDGKIKIDEDKLKKEIKEINKLDIKEILQKDINIFYYLDKKNLLKLISIEQETNYLEKLKNVFGANIYQILFEKTNKLPLNYIINIINNKYSDFYEKEIIKKYFEKNPIDAKLYDKSEDTKLLIFALQKNNLTKYIKNIDFLNEINIKQAIDYINMTDKNIILLSNFLENLHYDRNIKYKDNDKNKEKKFISDFIDNLNKNKNNLKDYLKNLKLEQKEINYLTNSIYEINKEIDKKLNINLLEKSNISNFSEEQLDLAFLHFLKNKDYNKISYFIKNDKQYKELCKYISNLKENVFIEELKNNDFKNLLQKLIPMSGYDKDKKQIEKIIPRLSKKGFIFYLETMLSNLTDKETKIIQLLISNNENNKDLALDYCIKNLPKELMINYWLSFGDSLEKISPLKLKEYLQLNEKNFTNPFPFTETNFRIRELLRDNFETSRSRKHNNQDNYNKFNFKEYLKEFEKVAPEFYILLTQSTYFNLDEKQEKYLLEKIKRNYPEEEITKSLIENVFLMENFNFDTINKSIHYLIDIAEKSLIKENEKTNYYNKTYKENLSSLLQGVIWSLSYDKKTTNLNYKAETKVSSENLMKVIEPIFIKAPHLLNNEKCEDIQIVVKQCMDNFFSKATKKEIEDFYERFFYMNISQEYYHINEQYINNILLSVAKQTDNKNAYIFLENLSTDLMVYDKYPRAFNKSHFLERFGSSEEDLLKFDTFRANLEKYLLKTKIDKNIISQNALKKINKI